MDGVFVAFSVLLMVYLIVDYGVARCAPRNNEAPEADAPAQMEDVS
jgi:hypothetical protein